MTSRRSPPRRSSGNSARGDRAVRAVAVALRPAGRGARRTATADALKETLAGAGVDWEAGTIAATGGRGGGPAHAQRRPVAPGRRSGAPTRPPSPSCAAALATLPLGSGNKLTAAEIDRAVGRARDVDVQYQSNGGAIVRVEIRFGDWLETPSAPDAFAVAVPSMHLSAAPTARVGKRDVRVGAAVYRVADGKAAKNVADGRVDKDGRLVLAGDAQLPDEAGARSGHHLRWQAAAMKRAILPAAVLLLSASAFAQTPAPRRPGRRRHRPRRRMSRRRPARASSPGRRRSSAATPPAPASARWTTRSSRPSTRRSPGCSTRRRAPRRRRP